MSIITFPGFNLKFNISPVAFRIGNIEVYWYSVIISLAFVIAMIAYKKQDGKFGIKFDDIFDLSIYLIPISVISARLYYILFNLKYYLSDITQIFNMRSGGMAIYGGIAGGVITCYFFCKKRKINILDLTDYIVPYLALRASDGEIRELYKYRSIWY